MNVIKRNGTKELVSFDKCVSRVSNISKDLCVNCFEIAQQIITHIFDGVHTSKLDELAAEICASKITIHPDYGRLASRIIISNHHKKTSPSYSEVVQELWDASLINKNLYNMVMANKDKINNVIDYNNDFKYDYFGFKTLERSYLMRIGERIVERPQHALMRVALSIHKDDLKEAIKVYKMMSDMYFTHATPTLYNMGTNREQGASCFLINVDDDSIDGIFKTLGDCAKISKYAGGIGISFHKIRSKGSIIRSTNGHSDGIVPMLKVFNETARYVNQSGRRNGSIACYIEVWHADIENFLMLRRNTGVDSERARDLFYALWICDLFMSRVEKNEEWSLMCPDMCKGLDTSYGVDFEKKYVEYENEGRYLKKIRARELWEIIMDSQIETGMPYILYKDAVNRKNNQGNLGVIASSNLCAEIVEYTSPDEIAVCNLASIILPKFVEYENGKSKFNYQKLREITRQITRNLNKVIDYNYYPVIEAERSNRRHRPIGIGIQGLADVFAIMKMPFDSMEAMVLNRAIAENIYYAACEASMELAKKRKKVVQEYRRLLKTVVNTSNSVSNISSTSSAYSATSTSISMSGSNSTGVGGVGTGGGGMGEEVLTMGEQLDKLKKDNFIIDEEILNLPMQYAGAYSSFMKSPAQEGKLQFDLWGVEPDKDMKEEWDKLKSEIGKHGMRNSLLVALMPTASTSQINGSNECFEPFTNNIYVRRTLAGSFIIVNKYLVNDLLELGLWTQEMKDKIILADGSIQNIDEIPQNIKNLYKTVWEIKQRSIIDLAAGRGAFVDQTQSMNLWVKEPTYKILSSMHFYSWQKGLKTGIYYLRSQAKTSAQKFSVDIDFSKTLKTSAISAPSATIKQANQPNQANQTKQTTQANQANQVMQGDEVNGREDGGNEGEGCLMCSA